MPVTGAPEPDPFDHRLALEAADACDATATRLAAARRGVDADAAHATDEWLGPHRDRFDRDLAAARSRSETTEARLRHLADDLRAASSRARRRDANEPGP